MSDDPMPDGVDVDSTDGGRVQVTVEDEATHGTSRRELTRLEALTLARSLLEASRSAGQAGTPAALARARARSSATDGGDRDGDRDGHGADADGGGGRSRVQVRCHQCGFSWTDQDGGPVVTCPACDARTEPTG